MSRKLDRRLWRIRLAYGAGSVSIEHVGAIGGHGWAESSPAYCNIYVGSINTADLTEIDYDFPKRVKVGGAAPSIEEALRQAEDLIATGRVDRVLEYALEEAAK